MNATASDRKLAEVRERRGRATKARFRLRPRRSIGRTAAATNRAVCTIA